MAWTGAAVLGLVLLGLGLFAPSLYAASPDGNTTALDTGSAQDSTGSNLSAIDALMANATSDSPGADRFICMNTLCNAKCLLLQHKTGKCDKKGSCLCEKPGP